MDAAVVTQIVGAVVALVGMLLLFMHQPGGGYAITLKFRELEISTPGLGVLVIGAGLVVVPLFAGGDAEPAATVASPTATAASTATATATATSTATATATPTEPPPDCFISGNVYNLDDVAPLPAIRLKYERQTEDESDSLHDGRSVLAQTAPDGSFQFDCSTLEAENFPAEVFLAHADWQLAHPTDLVLERDGRREGVNIWASDEAMRDAVVGPDITTMIELPIAVTAVTRPAVLRYELFQVDLSQFQRRGIDGLQPVTP